MRRNIPYVKYGGLKFLEAAHVKDMLSVLKWAENPATRLRRSGYLKLLPGMGPANAARCYEQLEAGEFMFPALAEFPAAGRLTQEIGRVSAS